MTRALIGVFDSGVGGLSVLRAIREHRPADDLVYVADSGFAPYGDRDAAFIVARAEPIARFLVGLGVDAVVVACNTATVVAVDALRAWCPVPVVAIEPAIKPAAALTRTGTVGVLATRQTLASPSVARLRARFGGGVRFVLQACPGWVEQVENADLEGPVTRSLVERHLLPVLSEGADTLVLGCTHYPFLAPLIRACAGPQVSIIDPSQAVARELSRRLVAAGGTAAATGDPLSPGGVRCFTSADPARTAAVLVQLWGGVAAVEGLPAFKA
jgi:glutamate racemase